VAYGGGEVGILGVRRWEIEMGMEWGGWEGMEFIVGYPVSELKMSHLLSG
jgi:hypothetical protein